MSSEKRRPCFYTAVELLDAYKSKTLTPSEVVKDILKRIEEVNSTVNAFIFVADEKEIQEQVAASEARYASGNTLPLDGVPVSIKDILNTKGWRTRYGSKALVEKLKAQTKAEDIPEDTFDHPTVERLREAGAIIIGKVTSPEFGWKGVTDSLLHGITSNPFNNKYSAGGSSGGSSSAVALGMCPLSVGSDAGGSVRIPAAFSNTSTIKATFARVAHAPPSAFGTLSNAGPMAVSIEDVALMLDVIAQPHLRDPYSILPTPYNLLPAATSTTTPKNSYLQNLKNGIEGVRIAVSLSLGGYVPYVHPLIEKSVREAAKELEKLGAIVEFVEPPLSQFDIYKTFKTLWCCGAANALSKRFPNVEERTLVDPGFVEIAKYAEKVTSVELCACEFTRATMGVVMNEFHSKYDLLVTPTIPIPPFDATLEAPTSDPEYMSRKAPGQDSPAFEESDKQRWWTWTPFTYPFNLTKQPAASVPCGYISDPSLDTKVYMNPFPAGLQIVGSLYNEELVLRAAYAFQNATNHLEPIYNLQSN